MGVDQVFLDWPMLDDGLSVSRFLPLLSDELNSGCSTFGNATVMLYIITEKYALVKPLKGQDQLIVEYTLRNYAHLCFDNEFGGLIQPAHQYRHIEDFISSICELKSIQDNERYT